MSTRFEARTRSGPQSGGGDDTAETVALVAAAKREVLLRVHRHRLRREDLEDAYSQATLELVSLARRGRGYAGRAHIGNALEQRFLARVQDRRRAVAGRSPIAAALEGAVPFAGEGLELPDQCADPARVALGRDEFERVLRHFGALTEDQRRVLETQLALDMRCEEFCSIHGWTAEKYRKVAQRGRARLRELLAAESGDRVPRGRALSEQAAGTDPTIAGLRLDTSHDGTDIGPNRAEDGPRWRVFGEIPQWAHWSVRHPPGL